jgi:glucose-6-phosphate dehydrogenase assembly protein OpcA
MAASDLNWGRLTAWRTLLASFWDVPDYRPHLERIDRVRVEYDPPDVAPEEIAPKALLALGWIATRLGWAVEGAGVREDNSTHFLLRAGSREVRAEMLATERIEACDGMLVSVVLSAESAEFRVSITDDRKRLETEATIDGARTIGRVLSYEQKTEGQRLSRELSLLKRDVIYEEALLCAAQLIQVMR